MDQCISGRSKPLAGHLADIILGAQVAWPGESQELVVYLVAKAAGFELIGSVKRDKEKYPISGFVLYTLRDGRPDEHRPAGIWLDCLFAAIRQMDESDQPNVVARIQKEIERSKPLTPISLISRGVYMAETPPDGYGLIDHVRDGHPLGAVSAELGIHVRCGGAFVRHADSTEYDCVKCKECGIRTIFPRRLATYGDLRDYFRYVCSC